MIQRAKSKSRSYDSITRTEQARYTRKRILDAAVKLFLERGFAKTTVSAVAAAAEISPDTIYATFDGKRGLLEGVIDASIMCPGRSVPLEEQSDWNAIALNSTARARLRAYVEFSCRVLTRTRSIHQVIRSAVDSEPLPRS